ncbi:MAG: proline--tRNA ligase [bacterium]|nr:proline--tRNA ligase [bacterium]
MADKDVGITAKKNENFSEWYTQVVAKAELADYTPVSGCMVLRPYSYAIWEKMQEFLDKEFKKTGHKNAYFPLFIPEKLLKKESKHVEGFAPEVAWVTEAGDSKLSERLAIRPTSETIMYDSYARWVRSWRDLPLLINQWCSVVRWEFKYPRPFLRTREFLWQEGHTVHATKKEAADEAKQMIDIYLDLINNYLAMPVLSGRKTEKEKFAGAEYTLTMEGFMPDGKALQMGTSHNLGQNFANAFDISFSDKDGKTKTPWQTSWGVSTRLIGALIMMHGDDRGLVLPPKIAPIQAVIIPIMFEKTKAAVLKKAAEVQKSLKCAVELDSRDSYTPGWKFNEWEMKGVPIRIELGPKDIEKKQAVVVRRDTGDKEAVALKDLNKRVIELLAEIQDNLFKKAEKILKTSIIDASSWSEFEKALKSKKIAKAAFCGKEECEDDIKAKTGASSMCKPLEQPKKLGKCICCKNSAEAITFFAKSH